MTQDKPTIDEELENKFKPLVWGNTAYTRKKRVEECVIIAKEFAASLNRQGWTKVEEAKDYGKFIEWVSLEKYAFEPESKMFCAAWDNYKKYTSIQLYHLYKENYDEV